MLNCEIFYAYTASRSHELAFSVQAEKMLLANSDLLILSFASYFNLNTFHKDERLNSPPPCLI